MKKFFFIALILITPFSIVLGCSCANFLYTTNEKFITSDFVGTVKIISTEEVADSTTWRSYIANIEPLAIFKGKAPEKLRVAGSKSGPNWGASCEKTVKAGEEWLVAISKNSLDQYPLSYCSFASRLKSAEGKNVSRSSQWQAIKHYQFLKRNVPELHRNYVIYESTDKLSNYLDQYDGKVFSQRSAHYLIIYDNSLKIKSIEVLQGFSSEFDKKLVAFLKQQTKWEKENPRYNTVPVKDGTKYVLGVYYHDGGKNFLSSF